MSVDVAEVTERLRRPEHTGENRCVPCTVVNLLVAAGLAAAIGAVLFPWTGLFAFALFVVVVYLRGYLVPGTPTITERYFPRRLLALFGKAPPAAERTFADGASAEPEPGADATDDPLVAAGVVRRDGDDVEPTRSFRDEWTERVAALDGSEIGAADVRSAFGAADVSRVGDRSFVLDGRRSVRWASDAALLADVAAAELLRYRLDGWTDLDGDRQRSVLTGLRLSRERCPACGGAVATSEERAESCCRKPHLLAEAVCEDCGALVADAAVVDEGDESTPVRSRLLRP